MQEEFVSHEIATEYQPVEVEKCIPTSTARKPELFVVYIS